MTQSRIPHAAAMVLSYELDEWVQSPAECGWYFSTSAGRLIAEELDDEGKIKATYSVALADIPFTKHDTN